MKNLHSRKTKKCPKCKYEPKQTFVVGYPSEEYRRSRNIYCQGYIPSMSDINGYVDTNRHCDNYDFLSGREKLLSKSLHGNKKNLNISLVVI
tara:strand:+ start:223 stop:498 length:276 start_codon:yes stop_codon:yes gene_type:complete